MDGKKRTLEQVESELEAIKLWLADLSDDLTEDNAAESKEVAKVYVRLTQLQQKLKSQCRSLTN